MSSQSLRLQEAGYYSEEGCQTVQYKEGLSEEDRKRPGSPSEGPSLAHGCFTMSAYWDELQTLRQRVMLLPPNTPNFALESQDGAIFISLHQRGTFLGNMVYDQDGPAYQTFALPDQGVFQHVRLQVLNNWGE
ncbi:hypothetical protein KUCAC02_035159 [Chaenocephalus aceratus]|nr:hypothetical protein KUCAC02_035159 [Chaenocephalus aceratus]